MKLKWEAPERWEKSMKKWTEECTYDTLIDTTMRRYIESGLGSRDYVWGEVVWRRCGFCDEFDIGLNHDCEKCPLFPINCIRQLELCHTENNTMSQLHKAWVNSDRAEYERLRLEFVEVLKQFKPEVLE